LVLTGIELPGNVQWAADVVAELVVLHRRHKIQPRSLVAGPGIRIENRVPDILVGRAVELLPAAARNDADLAAGGPPELRRIGGREDLDLLRGIHIRRTQAGAVGPRAHRGSPIVRDQALRSARA